MNMTYFRLPPHPFTVLTVGQYLLVMVGALPPVIMLSSSGFNS
jgi:hypothetical protein